MFIIKKTNKNKKCFRTKFANNWLNLFVNQEFVELSENICHNLIISENIWTLSLVLLKCLVQTLEKNGEISWFVGFANCLRWAGNNFLLTKIGHGNAFCLFVREVRERLSHHAGNSDTLSLKNNFSRSLFLKCLLG